MAGSASRAKRDREKARDERRAQKRERREEATLAKQSADNVAPKVVDQEAVLARIAELHERFAREEIDFEEFEAAKNELMESLDI